MSVARIEEHRQVNGVSVLKFFCRPTAKFPDAYFYTSVEAVDLVRRHTWCLNRDSNRVVVMAHVGDNSCKHTLYFHKELYRQYHGRAWQEDIDHIDIVEIDNTDDNLNAVSHQQNKMNTFTRGYFYDKSWNRFQSGIVLSGRGYRPYGVVHREDEACIQQHYIEQVHLRELMGADFYQFNFFKYRRGSEDLLDLERTGKISEEKAVYKHILRYSQNAL